MTTRKTLKEFFQSRGSVQNSISINPEDTNQNESINEGDDIGSDFESGEKLLDLDEKTTGLLGDYVSFLMSSYDHKTGTFNGKISNFYRPGPKNSRSPSNDRGNRVHDPAGPDGDSKVFVETNSVLGSSLRKYSNSGYISNLDSIVKKEGDPSNHEILKFEKQKQKNTGNTFYNQRNDEVVVRETLSSLVNNNRYNPGKFNQQGVAYSEKGVSDSANIDEQGFLMYDELGNDDVSSEVKAKNLFNLVPDLLKRYTGVGSNTFSGKTKEEIYEILINNENKVVKTKDLKTNIQDSLPDSVKNSGYQQNKGDFLKDERSSNVQKGDYSDFSYEDENHTIMLGSIRLKIVISLILDLFKDKNAVPEKQMTSYISKVRGKTEVPFFKPTLYPLVDCVDEGLNVMFGENSGLNKFNVSDVSKNSEIINSRHFWIPFFKVIIKESDRIRNKVDSLNTSNFLKYLENSRIVQFVNILSYIGDSSLRATEGSGISLEKDIGQLLNNSTNVDLMPDTLGNIASKSKNLSGKIAWGQGTTPSLYLMPGNVSRAAMLLGTGIRGTNPLKSVASEKLSSQTIISPLEGDYSRLPNSLVEKIENELEASYVPFYFHDLRTNEIISFHAFLETLSDSFSPGVNPSSGYGRMDPVQIYKGTTRQISLSFKIAATSKKDFNEMWWKINKLVTLVYPKWSKGTEVFDSAGNNVFTQPFSQIIEGSPMIRLRVGDVIKSNYSELALARQFGIGNADTKISGRAGINISPGMSRTALGSNVLKARNIIKLIADLAVKVAFGSPVAWAQFGSNLTELTLRSIGSPISDIAATAMFDTRVSNIAEKMFVNSVNTQNSIGYEKIYKKFLNPNDFNQDLSYGPKTTDKVVLAASLPDFPYYSKIDSRYYHLKRSVVGEIIGGEILEDGQYYYFIKITDIDSPTYIHNKVIIARFDDFILSPEHMFLTPLIELTERVSDYFQGKTGEIDEKLAGELNRLGLSDDDINPFRMLLSESAFMSPFARTDGGLLNAAAISKGEISIPTGNPFTRAFNSSKGRGLAGFISSLSFTILGEDTTWDVDYNSRAPKMITATISFNPVHDIAPGLDHSGFNRAPVYNVGDIMKSTSGDVYDSKGSLAERSFKRDSDKSDVSFKSQKLEKEINNIKKQFNN